MFSGQVVGVERKKTRPKDRQQQRNAAAPTTASAAQLFAPGKAPGGSNASGAVGSTGQSPGDVSSYDASGSKHKRTEKEFTVNMEPPRKKKRQGGRCKGCLAAGVSDTFLVVWKHERKVAKKCREVQETWTHEQDAAPVHAAHRGGCSCGECCTAEKASRRARRGGNDRSHGRSTRKKNSKVDRRTGEGAERRDSRRTSLHGSGGLQYETPGGAAAIAKEDMPRDAAARSSLPSVGRLFFTLPALHLYIYICVQEYD